MSALAWYGAAFVGGLLTGGAAALGVRSWRDRGVDTETGPLALVEGFDHPVFILDANGIVRHANAACSTFFDTETAVDSHMSDCLDGYPALRDAVADGGPAVVQVETSQGPGHFDVRVRECPDRNRVVSIRDVTEMQELQSRLRTQSEDLADLEAQNERLDQFASVISHDLRNPLDVAKGRTNAVTEMLDDPDLQSHLISVQDAHDRMQEIISDVLTLARHGQEIGETGFVPLETAATDAWSHVETGDATLTVDTQLVVEADPDRLHQLLENLFRNSVQHGDDDVSVSVKELPDGGGFAVSDDGPGIPAEKREQVLEAGYTGNGEGTGLGLSIVHSIAKAHGWTLRVTESASGGARFEFSGVEAVTDDLIAKTVE